MSLEEALNENTKAVKDLIGALAGKGGTTAAAATGKTGGKGGTTAAAAKPKITVETITEKAVAVKKAISAEASKHLIKTFGKADNLKAMKEENFAEFVAACDAALEAGEVEIPSEEDDL